MASADCEQVYQLRKSLKQSAPHDQEQALDDAPPKSILIDIFEESFEQMGLIKYTSTDDACKQFRITKLM